ncbi:Hypothetical protein BJL86_0174 [Dietzia timorensis]|uniref:Uncharacterized protein n=1 Tax=Dietzia timorensis TaxID=499555 RepID=A0A173LFJ2_9ACTN|nr:Hypothetical protein BJL86_0174 [Dietzia timorensis]
MNAPRATPGTSDVIPENRRISVRNITFWDKIRT